MIGVLVPAHDEARRIPDCLAALRAAARHPDLGGEAVCIMVALDACSDGTAQACDAAGVATCELQARNVGEARAAAAAGLLQQGARWLASTDADSIVPADWLAVQLRTRHEVFCGLVDLPDGAGAEWQLRDRFRAGERWDEGHGRIHGANLGVCAAAYRRVGGFAALSCHEDVDLVRRLQRTGAAVRWSAEACVVTSSRRIGRAPVGFATHLRHLDASRGVMDIDAGSVVPGPCPMLA